RVQQPECAGAQGVVRSAVRDEPVRRASGRSGRLSPAVGIQRGAIPRTCRVRCDLYHRCGHRPARGPAAATPRVPVRRTRRGLVGYEVDAIYGDSPAGLVRLAHSPFVDHGRTRFADMTLYTAESGAIVFASGSMQWNWGLDGYNAPAWHSSRTNEPAQQLMRNVLNRMNRGRGEHGLAPRQRSNT